MAFQWSPFWEGRNLFFDRHSESASDPEARLTLTKLQAFLIERSTALNRAPGEPGNQMTGGIPFLRHLPQVDFPLWKQSDTRRWWIPAGAVLVESVSLFRLLKISPSVRGKNMIKSVLATCPDNNTDGEKTKSFSAVLAIAAAGSFAPQSITLKHRTKHFVEAQIFCHNLSLASSSFEEEHRSPGFAGGSWGIAGRLSLHLHFELAHCTVHTSQNKGLCREQLHLQKLIKEVSRGLDRFLADIPRFPLLHIHSHPQQTAGARRMSGFVCCWCCCLYPKAGLQCSWLAESLADMAGCRTARCDPVWMPSRIVWAEWPSDRIMGQLHYLPVEVYWNHRSKVKVRGGRRRSAGSGMCTRAPFIRTEDLISTQNDLWRKWWHFAKQGALDQVEEGK